MFDTISFDLPKNNSNVIKVIGVGGGGGNAINYMCKQGIKGVDFIICNTDSQALNNSPVPVKIQLGVNLTEGLGAGANPEVGRQAAQESQAEIEQILDSNTKMVFITAGMGGGTGTGAAPVIAEYAKSKNILTVGIVTMPFQFEGKVRMEQAMIGIEKLRKQVDSLIVINNNKLREVYGNLGFKSGFAKADEVLATASRGIAEVITNHYSLNIDLRDARTVLADSGTAIMGSSTASGENRAKDAVMAALDSPLLNDNKISGAKNVLLLIVFGTHEITMDEMGEINDYIQQEAGFSANIIMGAGEDESLGESISVTVIATGFNAEQQNEIVNAEPKKTIYTLENDQVVVKDLLKKDSAEEISFTALKENNLPEEKIVFTLEEEPVVASAPVVESFDEVLIPTTEYIAGIEVEHTVVAYEEEFVITSPVAPVVAEQVQVNEPEFIVSEPKQITFTFDNPINGKVVENTENELVATTDYIASIQVNEVINVVPMTDINSNGFIKYSLEDLEEPAQEVKAVVEPVAEVKTPELDFSFKVLETATQVTETPQAQSDEFLTTEMTIEETLKLRSDLRRKKMKEFNYKFANNPSHFDDFEKEPAYKRMGLDLEDTHHTDNRKSRMSFGTEGDDFQFRSNNSFLHDNVD
jgi:cell division protein FtsZ